MKNSRCKLLVTLIFLILLLSPIAVVAQGEAEVDDKRNKLIGYMLGKQLPSIHYSDKQVDDKLAQAAFDLYLKQLDFQKRFLLAKDADYLSSYATLIDDNLLRGTILLPPAGYDIMVSRIDQANRLVDMLLVDGLDARGGASMETDPEKIDFAVDEAELTQRWRLILKAEIMNRYLDLEEEYQAEGKSIDQDALWQEASDRISKRFNDFFNRLNQETLQDHYDRFFNAVARAFDPHTNYMAPDRKEDFDIHMRGSLEGIGALLR
ncbi:MAG: tail-specific protease, partial [Desulfobulbaceae bacterium]